MNSNRAFCSHPSVWWLFAALLATAVTTLAGADGQAAAASTPPPARSNVLQVQVNVPPSWRPMFEDRVSDTFASEVADVFRRRGYKGDIKELSLNDDPNPALPLLSINLVEWRMSFGGNIDCTFGATLQANQSVRHLGSFNGIAFRWMSGPGRFGMSDSLTQAADDAIRQLYDSIAKTQLVPGLVKR